jgi:hypothetical protein
MASAGGAGRLGRARLAVRQAGGKRPAGCLAHAGGWPGGCPRPFWGRPGPPGRRRMGHYFFTSCCARSAMRSGSGGSALRGDRPRTRATGAAGRRRFLRGSDLYGASGPPRGPCSMSRSVAMPNPLAALIPVSSLKFAAANGIAGWLVYASRATGPPGLDRAAARTGRAPHRCRRCGPARRTLVDLAPVKRAHAIRRCQRGTPDGTSVERTAA